MPSPECGGIGTYGPRVCQQQRPYHHPMLQYEKLARLLALAACAAMVLGAQAAPQGAREGHPKLMGMNIGAKNYDNPKYNADLSRLDIAILGFHPGWRGDRG